MSTLQWQDTLPGLKLIDQTVCRPHVRATRIRLRSNSAYVQTLRASTQRGRIYSGDCSQKG